METKTHRYHRVAADTVILIPLPARECREGERREEIEFRPRFPVFDNLGEMCIVLLLPAAGQVPHIAVCAAHKVTGAFIHRLAFSGRGDGRQTREEGGEFLPQLPHALFGK